MVHVSEYGHPSKYWPGLTWVNLLHATKAVNLYATPTTTKYVKYRSYTEVAIFRNYMTSLNCTT